MPDYESAERTPINNIEEQERYLIHSRLEIQRVLNELRKRPDIITAYFNQGKEYLLTAVLDVLPDRDLVVLDYGPDEKQNQRALDGGRLVCVTKHDNIDIKFTCDDLKRARYQGGQVFAAPLPASLYRLQRREYFRVSMPSVNPVLCEIPREGEEEPLALPLVDLSVGGVGLLDREQRLDTETRAPLPGCRIELPGFGALHCDLEVRNIVPLPGRDGRGKARRIGCAFGSLSMDQHVMVQRYIHKVQVEQNAVTAD